MHTHTQYTKMTAFTIFKLNENVFFTMTAEENLVLLNWQKGLRETAVLF